MNLDLSFISIIHFQTVSVDYWTKNGTAFAGPDYVHAQGTLTFAPGETVKHFIIEVIDDDVFEEDEHFYIHLGNLVVDGVAAKEKSKTSVSSFIHTIDI